MSLVSQKVYTSKSALLSATALYGCFANLTGKLSGGGGGGPANWWDGFQPQDANVTAIQADGWRATYTNPPTFDPVGSPKYTVVRRDGFDASGVAQKVVDELVLMSRTREPYPNQLTLTASDVALQNFIYASDEIATGIINNSTRAYPQPIAMWMTPDLGRATSGTYTVRLAVAHGHARSGRPVAAVKFTATDQSAHSVSVTVSALSTITYSASGLTVPHFSTALDLSTLTAEDLITVDATIYPWVGTAFTISTDASAYPSPNLCVVKFLNDKSGTFGTAYAYVAPTGNDGTGVTSETPGTAQATPYLTVAAAAQGIKTYNNTNFTRNNAAGGIVRLEVGTYTNSSFSTVEGGPIPLVVEAVSAANKATTIYQDAGSSISNSIPGTVKFKDITLKKTVASAIFLDNRAVAGSTNMIVFENCSFDLNAQTVYNAWIFKTGRIWLLNCDGDAMPNTEFSTEFKTIVTIGCNGDCCRSILYGGVGNKDLTARVATVISSANRPASIGPFYGFNHFGQGSNGKVVLSSSAVIGARGMAVVGNVLEHYGGITAPAFNVNSDSTLAMQNIVMQCNTIVGSRSNLGYQSTGTVEVAKSGYHVFTIHREINSKSDVFGTNANLVGNWPIIYKPGFLSNSYLEGDTNNDAFGVGEWAGEIAAIGETIGTNATPVVADWADDQSFTVAGAGDGDYTPGPLNALPLIPSGLAPYSHDQKGKPIPNDGTGVAGAIQE